MKVRHRDNYTQLRRVETSKKICNASDYIYGSKPSEYLIDCISDGMIRCEDVVMELIKFLSEDDLDEVIRTLGLDDEYYE